METEKKTRYPHQWVNSYQTRDDYKAKYKAAKDAGFSRATAKRLASWTWPHVKEFIRINRGKEGI